MAVTEFDSSAAQTVKLWADRLYADTTSDQTLTGSMISDGTITSHEDLQKSAGDQIKYDFSARIQAKGLIGMQSATGNENSLSFYQDTVDINQLRIPVAIPNSGTIDAQRVKFDLPETSYARIRDWFSERFALNATYQLAGYTATSIVWDGLTYTGTERNELWGMNSAVAPSSTRIVRPNGLTTDEGVNADSTATFTLSLVDQCVASAMKNRPYIIPMDGAVKFKMYVHVDTFMQAIQATTGANQFRDMWLAQIAAGKNVEAIGQSFVYNQTMIVATDKMPYGVHSSTSAAQTNVRRSVFVGKEAGCIAFGAGYSAGGQTTPGFTFREDEIDIGNVRRIAGVAVYGMSKTVYNSIDHGSIVVPTYTA